ncbi:kelch repeat and BTB domain-containing protein 12 [Hypomesus transpacificus]|uniref:kelch repeat and BTB domain-containing protein 12 n=1 Tax=Hypomesus transpacificus TaxID=137520 RepID=UPI001F07B5DE|nr:kelch repeat and BTB domain-containing protein 12 [Hypomesus transpacificus]XP_046880623.1 kelch repeat and BTB domain-containing protein 12 [Hypomesus transpacificus]XP_046880624.1 kelch repeat and BTB domain-containing protein 12 [Hypomesus transpacificus]
MDLREKHGLVLLDQLRKMRETEMLTDVVLVAEGISFPCHRLVLSAFSPYFRVMFTCGLRECNNREVILRDTPADSLGLLLNYMYCSELPLSNDNVQGVSIAAFLLQMDEVFSRCQLHMRENMDASNCLGVYYYARDLGAEQLGDHAQCYLRQHFVRVCQNEEVLDLEAHQLGKLLSSDDLNISREETILDVVLRWVRHDVSGEVDGRSRHLPELLRKVRLPLVSPDYLREAMKRNTSLLANAECMEMLEEALEVTGMHPSAAPRRLKLRYGMETTDLLLCIGNEGGGIRSRYGSYAEYSFCYAPSTGRTHYITSPRYGEALGYVCAGVVTEGNDIIVAGEAGARKMARQKDRNVEIFSYQVDTQGSWEHLSSAEYRDSYALGSLGDTLYLLGGQMKLKNQYLITNCVERWSLKGGPWRSAAPLPLPLAYHSVVRMKGRLYVLGGRTPQSYRMDDEPDRLSNRLLEYDPESNKWTELGPMKFSKYRCSAVALNGEIYVLGGIGCEGVDCGQSRRCLDAVEIYNPDGDFWREGPTLPSPQLSLRTNGSNAGVVGGKLYVCGYYKGADRHDNITKDILELNPWENRWTVVRRSVLMHDGYDVCLVANLNPRGLMSPPVDLVTE